MSTVDPLKRQNARFKIIKHQFKEKNLNTRKHPWQNFRIPEPSLARNQTGRMEFPSSENAFELEKWLRSGTDRGVMTLKSVS